ncbi:ROK family transcriptional regulator [Tateyamaria omphalii]|uniref:ROK family transcriptional regulator n=1 Tax=Tateyamaria omphalii TaxID=299262 RepID=UPI001C998E5B|nr:ROK family transcriptional regulator [Tateyamaria omphalii]MBY5935276.1 ROK family transcriptional regulator [Tateyamaria omphalii]
MELDHVRTLSGGINQTGVRAYNERLILSILQRNGGLPGSDLARRTGLSSQTASVILRKLEQDGLLIKGAPVKGKVGKPSVPYLLNPDGVFSVGLKIGRRSADLLVLDAMGQVRHQLRHTYDYPLPGHVFDFLRSGFAELMDQMDDAMRARLCGVGIAAPFELWSWHELLDAPPEEFAAWKDADFVAEVARITDLPVRLVNDATAACRAEHVFGIGREYRDYVYFFLGAFVGGGVVLDHAVFEGSQKNAGAFGTMPVADLNGTSGHLIDLASIRTLEVRLIEAGEDPRQLWQQPQDWAHLEQFVVPWLEQTADALAIACVASCAVIDVEAVVIDGAMPTSIRARLVDMTGAALATKDMRGLFRPKTVEGQIGGNARGIGAATGPIIGQFLLDRSAAMFEQA